MISTILSTVIATSIPPYDYYDEIQVGQQWDESYWTGTFTTTYTDFGDSARFEYTLFLDPQSNISLTDFTLITLSEDMFEWDFEIAGGSTLFISFETPQIGYTNAWGTLYNDNVFGSAHVFQTIAPIPAPGALALLGASLLTFPRRRRG